MAFRIPIRRLSRLSSTIFRAPLPPRPFLTPACIRLTHNTTPTSSSTTTTTTSTTSAPEEDEEYANDAIVQKLTEEWATYNDFPKASSLDAFSEGNTVTIHGYLVRRRVHSSKLVFADLQLANGNGEGPTVQIVSSFTEPDTPAHTVTQTLRAIPLYSPVAVTGTIDILFRSSRSTRPSTSSSTPNPNPLGNITRLDLQLTDIQALNVFPKDIIVSKGVMFPPSARHLQIRFSDPLRTRLLLRPRIAARLRKSLDKLNFTEVETPILFKSTPEGAREFLVPTRRPGFAYALPQSPQQYKQMLMASGIKGYYQFARCFRDEDLRADRQPEFTQLDLEMGFATGEDVMNSVEKIISDLTALLKKDYKIVTEGDEVYLAPAESSHGTEIGDMAAEARYTQPPFPRISYEEAMTKFGSDKPDLRIPFEINRLDGLLPRSFVSMITDLSDPIVEGFRFRPQETSDDPRPIVSKFVNKLLKSLPPALANNPDGAPVALVVDSSKPLRGLSPLGFEGVTALETSSLAQFSSLQDGDVLVFQARANKPFQGEGSTALGTLRNLLYHSAVADSLLPRDLSLKFLWVTDFPMFTPNSPDGSDNGADPGQGGSAGFKATHHPFTAPLTVRDVELLATDPLKARADHYDLVVNGVELGGGSRRIHVAKMQEYVMREILKMTDEGVAQFSHLLEALRAGCPPHAGFALGFDRLVAVLTYTDSVRDVIAFPKSMKGEDLTVKSPGRVSGEEWKVYHLEPKPKK